MPAAADIAVTLVVARASNGVIGRDNAMPWHLPEDLRHFKATTMGHAIVMGRKTFESIGRALPGRHMVDARDHLVACVSTPLAFAQALLHVDDEQSGFHERSR